MAKQLQLTIPEPCHENWEAMTPVDKGRFCGACQKQVVDFSTMSDRQVAEFFKKPSTGSVCGRFMSDQLERDIEIPKKRMPWVKQFFTIALPAFLFSIKPNTAKAQGEIKVTTTSKNEQQKRRSMGAPAVIVPDRPLIGDTVVAKDVKAICTKPVAGSNFINPLVIENGDTSRFFVTGVITDQNGLLMAGASVRIKGTRTGVAADIEGKFKIAARRNDILVVSGVGIETVESTVTHSRHLLIKVNRNNLVVGDIVIVSMGTVSPYTTFKRRVIGFVTDEGGKPVAGAWVISKKRKFIATTDERGKFTCIVDKRDVLLFNSPGLEEQKVAIGKKDTLLVKLKSLKTTLSKEAISVDAVKLFPNPALAGSRLTIEFFHEEAGGYLLQLLNQSGQSIHQQQLRVERKARQVQLTLPQVPAGSYFLVLVNDETGKRFSETIIIN